MSNNPSSSPRLSLYVGIAAAAGAVFGRFHDRALPPATTYAKGTDVDKRVDERLNAILSDPKFLARFEELNERARLAAGASDASVLNRPMWDRTPANDPNASINAVLDKKVREELTKKCLVASFSVETGSGVCLTSARDENNKIVTYILSALHVVDKSKTAWVRGYQETAWLNAEVVAIDSKCDHVLLKLVTPGIGTEYPAVKLIPRELVDKIPVLSSVCAIGCPQSQDPFPSLGVIGNPSTKYGRSVTQGRMATEEFMLHSAPIFYGSSGGPVFLVENYGLLGVNTLIGISHSQAIPTMGYATRPVDLYAFLDSCKLVSVAPDGTVRASGSKSAPISTGETRK